MIEVFKTNITCPEKAKQLVEQIHQSFTGYKANFDLADCDKILRVVCSNERMATVHFIDWLKNFECHAEILGNN